MRPRAAQNAPIPPEIGQSGALQQIALQAGGNHYGGSRFAGG